MPVKQDTDGIENEAYVLDASCLVKLVLDAALARSRGILVWNPDESEAPTRP